LDSFFAQPSKDAQKKNSWNEPEPALQEVLYASIRLLTETLHINLNYITVFKGVKRKARSEQEKAHDCKQKKPRDLGWKERTILRRSLPSFIPERKLSLNSNIILLGFSSTQQAIFKKTCS